MDSTTLALIRKYINDTVEPYTYSDEEIETIYEEKSSNLYLTVAEIWLLKAIATKTGKEAKSYSIGNESYSFNKTTYDEYMEMYKFFLGKANESIGNFYERNGDTEYQEDYDYSELMGDYYDDEFS